MNAAKFPPLPEQILEWLRQEMAYRPQGHFAGEALLPSAAAVQRLCRGNMIPIWQELLSRVRSEKAVRNIRMNILVHGGVDGCLGKDLPADPSAKTSRASGRLPESRQGHQDAATDRATAAADVARLREQAVELEEELRRQMADLAREEAGLGKETRESHLDKCRMAVLEAYDEECLQVIESLRKCQQRLMVHVQRAKAARETRKAQSGSDLPSQQAVYTIASQSNSQALNDLDSILLETPVERSVREACEALCHHLNVQIAANLPEYDYNSTLKEKGVAPVVRMGVQEGVWRDAPDGISKKVRALLESPTELLKALAGHTAAVVERLRRETDRIDVRADAEKLRYKYENNQVVDPLSQEEKRAGAARSVVRLLYERQVAHVDQAMQTEDALLEAEDCAKQTAGILASLAESQSSERDLQLAVWSTERQVAGTQAAVQSLEAAVVRLMSAQKERRAAEQGLRAKWQHIVDFEEQRQRLERLHNELIRDNMAAATAMQKRAQEARAAWEAAVVPLGGIVRELAEQARDLVAREKVAFVETPHGRLPPLPVNLEGEEEKSFSLQSLSRAASGDVEAVPLLQRAELANQAIGGGAGGAEVLPGGSGAAVVDGGLQAVLRGLSFCHLAHESPAELAPAVARAVQEAETLADLVTGGEQLVAEAARAIPVLEQIVAECTTAASAQESVAMSEWLPRLRGAITEAQEALVESGQVKRMIDEWWEQPAATAVPWAHVGGENVGQWLARTRQLQAALRTRAELQHLERML